MSSQSCSTAQHKRSPKSIKASAAGKEQATTMSAAMEEVSKEYRAAGDEWPNQARHSTEEQQQRIDQQSKTRLAPRIEFICNTSGGHLPWAQLAFACIHSIDDSL